MLYREDIERNREHNWQMSVNDPARECQDCPDFSTFSDAALTRLCRCYGLLLRNRHKIVRKMEDMWAMAHLEGMEEQVPPFEPYPRGRNKKASEGARPAGMTAMDIVERQFKGRACSSREFDEALQAASTFIQQGNLHLGHYLE